MRHQLTPLEPPFEAEIDALLANYPKGDDGYLLKLFRVFANSPRFASTKGVSNLLDADSPLPLRERELIILRVTANWRCEYEWGVHVAIFSKAARLSEQQVRATLLGDCKSECWAAKDALLIECVDQLCDKAALDDATLSRFQSTWALDQQLEILSLCGNYYLISLVAKVSGIDNEPDTPGFPA